MAIMTTAERIELEQTLGELLYDFGHPRSQREISGAVTDALHGDSNEGPVGQLATLLVRGTTDTRKGPTHGQ